MHCVRYTQQSTDLTSSGQILNCQFLGHGSPKALNFKQYLTLSNGIIGVLKETEW